jgi:hypothetical protein
VEVAHLYKITNKLTGDYYVGKHNGWEQNGYWGSGLRIKSSVEKYGKENFNYEILCYGSPEFILKLEEKYVTLELIESDEKCLNLMAGGYGSTQITDDTRKKLSEARKGHEMYKDPIRNKKISESLLGNKHSEERKEKIRQKALGRIHSLETREKRGKSISNLLWMNNGQKMIRVNKEVKDAYLSKGFSLGKLHMSEETKKKISIYNKNRHAKNKMLKGQTNG